MCLWLQACLVPLNLVSMKNGWDKISAEGVGSGDTAAPLTQWTHCHELLIPRSMNRA